MKNFEKIVRDEIEQGHTLFYNSDGDKRAYQLGIKHLSSAEHLGFTQRIAGYEKVISSFYLVDLEKETITLIIEGSKLTLVPLMALPD